jgi:DNA-binding Lrp family transcriptional regulator
MREIGQTLKAEQNLTSTDIAWLTGIAEAILRVFVWDAGQPMQILADDLGMSPQTLYTKIRQVIRVLMLVRRGKQSVEMLTNRINELQDRLAQVEQAYATAQSEVQRLTKRVAQVQAQVVALQDEVIRLQGQWTTALNRLIVVLKLSGRCTVRSIVEVLEYGFGVSVSVGYVQGIIAKAGTSARPAMERLWKVVTLSGAISIDEVFFKELGRKILGVVIVDPLSGLILRLERCSERSSDAIGKVIQDFAAAGFKEKINLCLTDMYAGYLEPVKTFLPKAVHQFCWFHINCFHIGAKVHQAKRAYERAVKALAAFDKKHHSPLSNAERQEHRDLLAARDQAQRHWNGAQRFQHLLMQLLWLSTLDAATIRLDQLIRAAAKVQNPYVRDMGAFLAKHRVGLLVFYTCLESSQHTLKRLSRSQRKWVPLLKRWAVPITSNAAEHVFRCLRRYTNQMDHFGTEDATQRFFDLFAFYYNVRILRSGKREGNSLLASAHVNVEQLFGTDDPYTILGFPPASQSFTLVKSVQSVAG